MGWIWEENGLLGFQALCLCWVVLLSSYCSAPVQNQSPPKPEPRVYFLLAKLFSEGHRNHWSSWLVSPLPQRATHTWEGDFPNSEHRQGDIAVTQTQSCVPMCALGAPICNWNPAAQWNLIFRGEKLQWFPLKSLYFLLTAINWY